MIENQTTEFRDVREDEPKGTADLIGRGNSGADRPNGQSAERSPNSHPALFPQSEGEDFRSRWHDVQSHFVDEPRHAVEEADQLVAAVISRLAEIFAGERDVLEREWSKGQDVSTEDLRQALRRYRSFFDRLLTM
jgi:hypothetical protein